MRPKKEVIVISDKKQIFDGIAYYLCGAYFQRKGQRLHRKVWEYHYGPILPGYHIHHKDGNRSNNNIDNLEMMGAKEHESFHSNQTATKEMARRNWKTATVAAAQWHKSSDGIAWHQKQGKENWYKRELQRYTCSFCGKEFQTKHIYPQGGNRFCSNNCKSSYRIKKGTDNVTRVCNACGKSFTTNKYSKQKFCGYMCARKQRWGKNDES